MRNGAHTALQDLPVLQLLPADVRELVIESFVPVTYGFGAPIIREGEEADALYVLVSGRARIVKRGDDGEEMSLSTLRPGDIFGEMGLLDHTLRTATVRASSDIEALRLDRSVFEALIRSRPEIRGHFELQLKHRSLHGFLRQNTAFAKLPVDALQIMVTGMQPLAVEAGQLVYRQQDPPGPMYVVEDGHLRVFTDVDGRRRYVAYLRKGDFFGEHSLFTGAARPNSVEAVSPCQLLVLTPATFDTLMERYDDFRAQLVERMNQSDYRKTARIPLDFEEEILPADVAAHEKVGPDQVQFTTEYRAVALPSPARGGPPAGDAATPSSAEAPFAANGRHVKRGKRIRRFRHVQQIDEMDCGAASLAMICRHFGRAVSLARIRQLVHTSLDGTSLKAICRAATELGLAARSVKTSPAHLAQMPLPAIVHWQGNHWVVLYDVDETHVKIADPGWGLGRISRDEFAAKWSGYAALFDYTEALERAPEGAAGVSWLWPFLRPFTGILAKALALALVVSGLQMVVPVFTQVIVDKVVVEQDITLLRIIIGGMLGALVFMALALAVQRYLLSFATVRLDTSTLDALTRRLLALPMSYFNTRRTGDIQRRLAGVREVRELVVEHGVRALSAVVQLVVALGLMLIYSPLLTLVFLAVTPLYALLMRFASRQLRPVYHVLEEAFGRYSSYQIDAIKGIETVKSLGAESAFRQLMLGQFNSLARRRFQADFAMLAYDGTIQMVSFLSIVLFLWVGARQVMESAMTIGALVAFNSLVALANAPIVTLLSLWDNLQVAIVLLDRLNDVFEQEPEQGRDRARLVPVKTLEGRIAFRGVGVRFGGPEAPSILEDVSFEVPANKRVAVVGRSGSGKTTLIKCLAGLLEPTQGTILYDGVDLRTLNYRDLRRHIGFVLQENHLFDDTIARNIAFGEEEPDMDQVLWAARVANAHEFIERLPLGYDTRVGESGIAISGGQRQRIAIARALYHRPPVLVFDEATSALDTESERAVKENIDKLLEGRTSFVVAHRLSTVRDADVILVLERGKLVERGTHDELMERQGLYFYLCSQQLEL